MSSLKQLTNSPSHNLIGEIAWDSKPSSYSWVRGSAQIESNFVSADILLQSEYPELFKKIGHIPYYLDSWFSTGSGSLQNVNAFTLGTRFVYATNLGAIYASISDTDLFGWFTATTNAGSADIKALTYGNGLYVYGGQSGILGTSTDALTWTLRTSGATNDIRSLLYNDGLYVYAGGGGTTATLATSTDAITWTQRTTNLNSAIEELTYGNGLYVAVGDSGALATSTDCITWVTRTSGTATNIKTITYGNGRYVYAGDNGILGTSTDGITWSSKSSGTLSNINSIIYSEGFFVFGADGGLIGLSYNIDEWFTIFSNTTSNITAIFYGSGKYLYGTSNNGSLKYSPGFTYNTETEFILPVSVVPMDSISYPYFKGD